MFGLGENSECSRTVISGHPYQVSQRADIPTGSYSNPKKVGHLLDWPNEGWESQRFLIQKKESPNEATLALYHQIKP